MDITARGDAPVIWCWSVDTCHVSERLALCAVARLRRRVRVIGRVPQVCVNICIIMHITESAIGPKLRACTVLSRTQTILLI